MRYVANYGSNLDGPKLVEMKYEKVQLKNVIKNKN